MGYPDQLSQANASIEQGVPLFLSEWEQSLGTPQPPVFPPKQISGTPKYPYNQFDYDCRFRTAVIPTYVNRDVVAALLPDWLELGAAADAPAGTHPLMYGFGAYSHFGPVWLPWPLGLINYHEFLCSIPNTKLRSPGPHYSGPFLFPKRILLDNTLAMIIGQAVAYPKRLIEIDSHDLEMSMRERDNSDPIASIRLTPQGSAHGANQIPALWRDRASQPICTSLGADLILFTHFQFEMERGIAQGVEVELTVNKDIFPGFSQGVHRIPPLSDTQPGGILLAAPCVWQPPFFHSSLDEINP